MKIVLPRSKTVSAKAYWITGRESLPTLARLPRPVAACARQLWNDATADPGARSQRRGQTNKGIVVVVDRLKTKDRLRHEVLSSWARRIERLSHELDEDVAVALPSDSGRGAEDRAKRVLYALQTADYRFDSFRSKPKKHRQRRLLVIPPASHASAYSGARRTADAVAEGSLWTRQLASTPPNVATPEWMANQARQVFRDLGARVEVLGPAALQRRGMGGILAVGAGSANPPRCVRVRFGSKGPKVALIGKGVTFDTGGISIKPAGAMDEMKYDKSGACTVLGIGRAAARLNLPARLELYVPLAENMLDGRSYRPGDIVTCMNGKTVEILNTDAEGRMILADALTWAAREKPDYLIDYATLTGACVVALGTRTAGLFSDDDATAEALLDAADQAGEYLWRLPLWSHFTDQMRGHHADLKNAGPRWGGASTAAAFLKQFTEEAPHWAHIDLAGPAYLPAPGRVKKDATGYGVALTVRWLQTLVE